MAIGSFKLPISSGGAEEWTRPSDWLPMPTVTAANDTFVALTAVFPEGQNWIAFLFTTNTGQYQVDWGDGTVTLHNSNTQAQYEYNYATISNSTLTSLGYKQAMITVTPVSGILTSINIQRRFTTSPAQSNATSSPYLDIILSMPNATSILFGNINFGNRYLERVQVLSIGSVTNLSNLFAGFNRLQSVTLPNTTNVTDMGSMFNNCNLLKNIPLFNTQNVLNMNSMFVNCGFESVPLLNTIKVTNMGTMFQGCGLLKTVPLFNTIAVITMNQMFQGCSSLRSVPLFNTQNVQSMQQMFASCGSLSSIPLFNTISVTTMNSMFISSGVIAPPLLNTANVTTMNSIFYGSAIQVAPLLNTIKVTNMTDMFFSCRRLQSIPSYDVTAITTNAMSGFAASCDNVDRIQTVFKTTVSVASCQLSRTALIEIFNNLLDRTSTTSATITITGNWGASALTAGERLIATSKNWVIVG